MNFDFIDTNVLILLVSIVAFLGIGLAIYGIITWLSRRNKVSNRLEEFVTSEDQLDIGSKARPIVPREIRSSLFSRTIISWLRSFLQFLGRFAPAKMVLELEHKLTVAGNPANLSAGSFFAIRLLFLFGGAFLAFLLNRDFKNINMNSMLLGILVIVICFLLPDVWLRGRMRTRQDEIRRGLPDALDMLSVCASAGLGFDQSLQKISGYWDTELGYELKRVTQEMEMGISRTDALRNMSNRLDVDDLSRFIAIIIQAEKIGMSYADVLHSQALQMRVLRRLRAREIANKLPGKMIIPVALLIFPAMLIVILGPAIPTLFGIF
ncbi:MAG: type II secretion system F family protein [Chloroflexota bacterium]|nr:type II secretion system F family protein [Chloroflexota bacterium]